MAWNLAGDCRKSLISSSSATASSAPATSAKVTLGWSLETVRALALPNCITLLPPPCMELRMKMNPPNSSRMGAKLSSRLTQMELLLCLADTSGTSLSSSNWVSWPVYRSG